jgi:hypothetical protein
MVDVSRAAANAVRQFWQSRDAQSRKQAAGGKRDQGARGAVTGAAREPINCDGFVPVPDLTSPRSLLPYGHGYCCTAFCSPEGA